MNPSRSLPRDPLRSSEPAQAPAEPDCRALAERLQAILARDPQMVWTPAGLVAASGAAPTAVAAALRLLAVAGRLHDTAPTGGEPRVRYAGEGVVQASAPAEVFASVPPRPDARRDDHGGAAAD